MFIFRKIWRALFSGNLHLEIRPFVLLPTTSRQCSFFPRKHQKWKQLSNICRGDKKGTLA